uniref:Fibronectin n=1 Tax=Phallusia mammillata TaxID=59560 RepID=A0A6F9DDR8_9ASCI|nr:fibronectin-like [Phallusia mammillata]
MWNQPWFSVQEYVLYIKKQSEPDSAYREVSPQPLPGQNMATISNLVPGEHYTIQLNATSADSHGHQSIVSTITINFSTLLPAISGVQIRSQDDGSILLTWDATQGIDNYVVKYRENRAEFTTRIISATETSYVIPSPTPGTQYEIHFYAEKGSAHSHTLVFTIDVPAALAPNCQDLDTGINYDVGASWNKNTGGYKLRCTCSAPQQYTCDTAEWCHADNEVYDPGETWTRVRGINLRESCTCRGRGGYQCEPTNCHDQGRGYDEGQTWTTAVGNIVSECVCRCAINSFGHSRCQSTCQQPFAVLNERAKRETDEPEVNE